MPIERRPQAVLARRARVAVAAGLIAGIALLDVALPAQHLAYALVVPLIVLSRALGQRAGIVAAVAGAAAIGVLERRAGHQPLTLPVALDASLLAAVWIAVILIVERYEVVLVRSYTTQAERLVAETEAKVQALTTESAAARADAARNRERDLAAIADAIPQLVWRARRDGVAEYFSTAWVAYTGLEPGQLRDLGIEVAIHPSDLGVARDRWSLARTDGSLFDCEYRLRRYDGTYRWFLARATPLRGRGGDVERWFGTCTDIEEQKSTQEKLERRFEMAHHVSETFQEASLPATLPSLPGITFSAVYRAGRREAAVGGDWYDAVRLIDGRLFVSIGDVSGSGLGAAITMIAMRQAMRGAAQIHADPVAVLEAADRTLRDEAPDRMVTAFAGIFDPVTRSFAYASAGHPPPLLRDAAGAIVDLNAPGLPLGVRRKGDTEARELRIEPGSLLVMYTDGLVESTHDLMAGDAHLHEVLAGLDLAKVEKPAQRIAASILAGASRDDVAIMTLAFYATQDDERYRSWTFDSEDRFAARESHAAFAAALVATGANDAEVVDAEMVFAELVGNVVRHARGPCEIVLDASGKAPVLSVLDRGAGFAHAAFLPVDALSESGRGLFIVRALTTEFTASKRPGGGTHARAVLLSTFRKPAEPPRASRVTIPNGR